MILSRLYLIQLEVGTYRVVLSTYYGSRFQMSDPVPAIMMQARIGVVVNLN
jgi:hypothetical protein